MEDILFTCLHLTNTVKVNAPTVKTAEHPISETLTKWLISTKHHIFEKQAAFVHNHAL